MEPELLTSEKTKSEEIDLVKEFETDIFLRTCIAVPAEDSPDRPPSFAQGRTAYQTVAEAAALKSDRPLTSKKA